MRRSQRKLRLMTGVASLIFFIAASLCFGFALQGQENANLLGFHINEDAVSLLNLLPLDRKSTRLNQTHYIRSAMWKIKSFWSIPVFLLPHG